MKFLLDHDVPDDLSYLLKQLGHSVFRFAREAGCMLLTCNRDDFLHLAATKEHHGLAIVIRRRTRGDERVALLRLIERAGETGLKNNVNFA